jgi:ammonium transporter, Amt family
MHVAAWLAQAAPQFPDQVTTNSLVQNVVYASGTVGAIMILAGLLMVDVGGVRRVNVFAAAVEKMIGFFIGFVVYFVVGFAIWNWQYYVAFGIEDPYWQSIQDWWLGGSFANDLAQNVDPAADGGMGAALNNQQIFIFFLAAFAGIVNVLIHLSVTERMKAAAYYVICVVAAVVSSVLSWLTWGSTGPLTNAGFHDFFGVGFVYLFPAGMALILVRKVGSRPGMYEPTPAVPAYRSSNLGLTTAGVATIFAGLPMVILSCLFFYSGEGFEAFAVSVTMADTSVGIAFNNLGLAWAGGALTGAALAYWKRSYIYLLLGPLGGYVACAVAFDVYKPWQTLLVAMGAPLVCYAVYEFSQARRWDEHKLTPLFLGAGTYGLLMVGLVSWGTEKGGHFFLAEGEYAYQGAEINLLWQVVGIVVLIGTGVVTAWILAFILERTIGLRLSEDEQIRGVDLGDWDLQSDMEAVVSGNGASAAPAPASGAPTAVPARPSDT